ncbi:MAG TPA: winged helix-turn-helix transcriptional regulator [Sedimenticola sp.]|nr:winged helix-turn-helix transcriptional regulator [Sedimenticola sp.]
MNGEDKKEALTLGVLEAVGERPDMTQRNLARRMDVALGLANSYLRRCVRKGWIKVKHCPGNRYLYYVTPKGFIEKSRLSARYLSSSLMFYRKAGESCLAAFDYCRANGWRRIALCGISDLAEIAFIRAQEKDIKVLGFIAQAGGKDRYLGHPIYRLPERPSGCEAFLVTDLEAPADTFKRICSHVDEHRVLVPGILEWRPAAGAANKAPTRTR